MSATLPPSERDDAVEAAADRFLEELQAGKWPSRAAYLREHPEIADDLGPRLALLERMHRVRGELSSHGTTSEKARRATPAGDELKVPQRIGKFEILAILGEGAFGAVYKARDPELQRLVAIKVPRSGTFVSRDDEERFLREARSAAGLRHPAIVRVHDVLEADGLLCIVSEYIEGENLADRIATRRPTHREAAELVSAIADALGSAHQAGVIHRDVKPGNILLDLEGRPHLTDFGLARHDEDRVTMTLEGQILGTPAYMSPEQARGDHGHIDGRTDIYALGVVLFELSTGERPFRGSRTALLHQVMHDEPRTPRTLSPDVPRDLETICLKAMAKEPGKRYASAGELAADLRRWLGGEPILARPVGRLERLWRWSRRNRAVAGLAAAVAASLCAGTLVAAILAVRASQARDDAQARLSSLNVTLGSRLAEEGDLLGSLLRFADAYRLDRGIPERESAHSARMQLSLLRFPRLIRLWFFPSSCERAYLSRDGRRAVVRLAGTSAQVLDLEDEEAQPLALEHGSPLWAAALTHDGGWVATGGLDGSLRLWNGRDGKQVGELPSHGAVVQSLEFDAGGRYLLSASNDKTARLWNVESREPAGPPLVHQSYVRGASFSPDGSRLVTFGDEGKAFVWKTATGERDLPPLAHPGPVLHARFSPDGKLIATASTDRTAAVWDALTARKVAVLAGFGNGAAYVAFSPDSRRLLVASYDSTARVLDIDRKSILGKPLPHILGVPRADISPDGRLAATCSYDATAGVWDIETGERVAPVLYHGNALHSIHFFPDGRRLLTASQDGTVRVWDLAPGGNRAPLLAHSNGVTTGVFSPDGKRIATATLSGEAIVWDAATGHPLEPRFRHQATVGSIAFSPDGSRIVTASHDGTAAVWDAASRGFILRTPAHGGRVESASFDPTGRRILTAASTGEARIHDAGAPGPALQTLRARGRLLDARYSPDGRRVATASAVGEILVWDAATGTAVGKPMRIAGEARRVRFSPDGARLGAASGGEAARIWYVETGEPATPPLRHTSSVDWVELSPDGRRVATASHDGTARIWDAFTGEPQMAPLEHGTVVLCVAFSPDGRWLATACFDGTARLWDALTGEPMSPSLRHANVVEQVVFSPDGTSLLTSSQDMTASIWAVPSGRLPFADADLFARLLSNRRLDATGGMTRVAQEELRHAWETLRRKYPESFRVTPEEAVAWHDRQADICERRGLFEAAAFHREPTVRPGTTNINLLLEYGAALVRRERFGQAAELFERASRSVADPYVPLRELLHCHLASGNLDGYRSACARILEIGLKEETVERINGIAWFCAVGPDGVGDMKQVLEMFRPVLEARKDDNRYVHTLGSLLYRLGDFQGAIAAVERSIAMRRDEGHVLDWIFLALAHARLGNAAEARRWLEKSRQWAELEPDKAAQSSWRERAQIRALLEETGRLLDGAAP